jgi:hypothetical protein
MIPQLNPPTKIVAVASPALFYQALPIQVCVAANITSTLVIRAHTVIPTVCQILFFVYCIEGTLDTIRDRQQINIVETEVYRRILGPVYGTEKENWGILINKEIYEMV